MIATLSNGDKPLSILYIGENTTLTQEFLNEYETANTYINALIKQQDLTNISLIAWGDYARQPIGSYEWTAATSDSAWSSTGIYNFRYGNFYIFLRKGPYSYNYGLCVMEISYKGVYLYNRSKGGYDYDEFAYANKNVAGGETCTGFVFFLSWSNSGKVYMIPVWGTYLSQTNKFSATPAFSKFVTSLTAYDNDADFRITNGLRSIPIPQICEIELSDIIIPVPPIPDPSPTDPDTPPEKSTIYWNASDKSTVNKLLASLAEVELTYKQPTDILSPIVRISGNSDLISRIIENANYLYIRDFKRFYNITDIQVLRTGLVELTCHVDVLMSHRSQLYKLSATVARQSDNFNLNLPDREVILSAKPIIKTQKFSKGFEGYSVVVAVNGKQGDGG